MKYESNYPKTFSSLKSFNLEIEQEHEIKNWLKNVGIIDYELKIISKKLTPTYFHKANSLPIPRFQKSILLKFKKKKDVVLFKLTWM